MDTAAQLISLSGGDIQLLPDAVAQLRAVDPAPGRTVLARGDDLVIADDDGAVMPAAAGGTLQHSLGNVQIVIGFIYTAHGDPSNAVNLILFVSIILKPRVSCKGKCHRFQKRVCFAAKLC